MKDFIQTGRTTRMLARAESDLQDGKYVVLVFINVQEANRQRKLAQEKPTFTKFIENARVVFLPVTDRAITWTNKAEPVYHKNHRATVYVDHFVLEDRYDNLITTIQRGV